MIQKIVWYIICALRILLVIKPRIKVNLFHLSQDYQGKRECLANGHCEIGMPCNLLLVKDSGIEQRHEHDPVLLTLNTHTLSVLHVAQADAVGADAVLTIDWLLNIEKKIMALHILQYTPVSDKLMCPIVRQAFLSKMAV